MEKDLYFKILMHKEPVAAVKAFHCKSLLPIALRIISPRRSENRIPDEINFRMVKMKIFLLKGCKHINN